MQKIGLNDDLEERISVSVSSFLSTAQPRCLASCLVSYYAEHDHYRLMDGRGMKVVTPVIMGTSAEPLIEWKKIYNIEKSFLSQG